MKQFRSTIVSYFAAKMSKTQTIFLLILILILINNSSASDSQNKILSRRKRYLAFPEGSSLSIALCMTVQMAITPGEIFTEGVNWGISYELPNDTKDYEELLDTPGALLKRRHRRDLYSKLEMIMKSMGYDGRNCVFRALCEASRRFRPKGDSLIEEVLRIVFKYSQKKKSYKGTETYQYYTAAQKGIKNRRKDCYQMYPRCPFSLIDLALGHYSALESF